VALTRCVVGIADTLPPVAGRGCLYGESPLMAVSMVVGCFLRAKHSGFSSVACGSSAVRRHALVKPPLAPCKRRTRRTNTGREAAPYFSLVGLGLCLGRKNL
jgi:hypothetical protein